MLKKFLIAAVLMLTLFAPALPQAYAGDATSSAPQLNSANFQFNLSTITHKNIKQANWINQGINYIFTRIVTILAVTVGSAAVLMITVGGFMILTSGGSETQIDHGKTYITKSVIGLAITLGAYIMVSAVELLIKSIFP